MAIWTLAKKELRLLLRDRMAAMLLLGMPLLFIIILGFLLGEGFGQKEDERLRVSLVDRDAGIDVLTGVGATALIPTPGGAGPLLAVSSVLGGRSGFPGKRWSEVVRQDLAETAGIRIEIIPSKEEAEQLVADHKRPAVIIFEPTFSVRVQSCSFLAEGINPFFRDGVELDKVDLLLLQDSKQPVTAATINQLAQVTMLRVLLPWMIGRAFERLSEPAFIERLGKEVKLPVPAVVKKSEKLIPLAETFRLLNENEIKQLRELAGKERVPLGALIMLAAGGDSRAAAEYNAKVGSGVQSALEQQFAKYNLQGKTWAALTKATDVSGREGDVSVYQNQDGTGFLRRGAHRYQILVPSYTVMFAFFIVLTVGWIFVSERREGTLKRLRLAPITRGQILLGKLIPCFLISLGQGAFLLLMGRLLLGMSWGPDNWSLLEQVGWLGLVVLCTSLAAIGLALLVASLARTELQVALFGAIPVLVLALIGGCVLPREMMPETTQRLTLLTPHGWALTAYSELLISDPAVPPNLELVVQACGVLAIFGLAFLVLAWVFLRLD
jgi:ABC-2 type transport system permease protein